MIIYVFIFLLIKGSHVFFFFFVNMQVGGKKSLFCIFVLYETIVLQKFCFSRKNDMQYNST